VVICLERGADLHMAQLVPLPLTVVSVSLKSRLVLRFWSHLTRVVLDKGPLIGCVCMLYKLCRLADHQSSTQKLQNTDVIGNESVPKIVINNTIN